MGQRGRSWEEQPDEFYRQRNRRGAGPRRWPTRTNRSANGCDASPETASGGARYDDVDDDHQRPMAWERNHAPASAPPQGSRGPPRSLAATVRADGIPRENPLEGATRLQTIRAK